TPRVDPRARARARRRRMDRGAARGSRPLPRERLGLEPVLLDDQVPVAAVDDPLHVDLLVPGLDEEPVVARANLLVVVQRDPHLLEAALVAAFAHPFRVRPGLEAPMHLRDALVHLAEELLVLLDACCPVHPPSRSYPRRTRISGWSATRMPRSCGRSTRPRSRRSARWRSRRRKPSPRLSPRGSSRASVGRSRPSTSGVRCSVRWRRRCFRAPTTLRRP